MNIIKADLFVEICSVRDEEFNDGQIAFHGCCVDGCPTLVHCVHLHNYSTCVPWAGGDTSSIGSEATKLERKYIAQFFMCILESCQTLHQKTSAVINRM